MSNKLSQQFNHGVNQNFSVNTLKAFNQIYNFAETKKCSQYKLDGTDKLVLCPLQHQIQNGDCFSELQEKESVNF